MGQQPLFTATSTYHLITAWGSLLTGVGASILLCQTIPWFWLALPLPWLLTVGGARKLLVEINHQAVHKNLYGDWRDQLWVSFNSVILWLQDFEGYFTDHVKLHHGIDTFATSHDPDAEFLLLLGFCPGLPKEAYWRLLRQTIVSPRFHRLFLFSRLRDNFITSSPIHRLMALSWFLSLLSGVIFTHSYLIFFLSWVFPLTFLYHISSLFQFVSEHYWFTTTTGGHENEET